MSKRHLPPWTQAACDQCGCQHQATRADAALVDEDTLLLCPGCDGYARGLAEGQAEIERLTAERDEARADLARLGGPDPDAEMWAELARLAGVEDGCSVPHAIVVGLIRRSLEQLREDWHRERCLRVECAQSAVGLVRWVRDGGHWDSRAGEPYPVDYACPQCRPSSDTLGDGSFVCAWHRAERIESACPAEPPSHDPEVQG